MEKVHPKVGNFWTSCCLKTEREVGEADFAFPAFIGREKEVKFANHTSILSICLGTCCMLNLSQEKRSFSRENHT